MPILTKGTIFADGDQVTSTKLNNLVDAAAFVAGSSGTTDDATLEVAGGQLRVKTIQSGNIASLAVTEGKIGANAVTSAKIAASAVGTTHLADSVVTGAKIFAGAGSFPIQTTQAVMTGTQTITGHATAWTDIEGLSLTLTRLNVAATGKVRVQAVISNTSNNGNYGCGFRIMRGSTVIGVGATAGNRVPAGAVGGYYGQYQMVSTVLDFIDDHDLTDATITYKVQARIYSAATGYINRALSDTDASDYVYRTISTLTLTEMV